MIANEKKTIIEVKMCNNVYIYSSYLSQARDYIVYSCRSRKIVIFIIIAALRNTKSIDIVIVLGKIL